MSDQAKAGFSVEDFVARSGASPASKTLYVEQLTRMQQRIGRPLYEATESDVKAIRDSLDGTRSGPHYAALLRMFYAKAGRKELNELLRFKQQRRRLSPNEILTLQDVQAMVDVSLSLRNKAIVATLWETGVRVHELLALDLADVREMDSPENGNRKIFTLWFKKTKVQGLEHEGYVIESSPALSAWIGSHPHKRPDAPLFCTWRGGRLSVQGVLHMIKGTARRAKIQKRVYSHLFRHSRATFLLASGLSEPQVKSLLGWDPGSTMLSRYSHLASKDSYRGLLRSMGMKPEKVEIERLNLESDRLKPVVPMVRPPGLTVDHQSAALTWNPEQARALVDVLKAEDPDVVLAMYLQSQGVTVDRLRDMIAKVKGASP